MKSGSTLALNMDLVTADVRRRLRLMGPRQVSAAAIVRSKRNPVRRISGFSLVEVMCAILILGIGLVGLTQGIAAALRSSKEAELQTTAALLAAGQIETLRAEGYVTDGETEGECGEDLSLYRWKQSVTSTTIDGLHEVTVAVEHSKSGQTIYELRTLLFDPPLSDSTLNSSSDRKEPPKSKKREGSAR